MKERDTLHNFLFEHAAIRGNVAHLDATWREVDAEALFADSPVSEGSSMHH